MCYNCWKGRNVPALHDRIAQHLMRIDKSLQVVENLEDVSSSQIIFLNSDRPPSIRERAAVLEKLRMLHLQMLKRRNRLLEWFDHSLEVVDLFAPTDDTGAI